MMIILITITDKHEQMINFHNCDCMDFMRSLPDKAYDLAIVDPPYGIGASNVGEWNDDVKHQLTKYDKKEWDNYKPTKEYFNELFRVSKNQIVCGGNYFADLLPVSNSWVAWDKMQPEKMHFAQIELIWTSFLKSSKLFRKSIASSNNRVSNSPSKAIQYLRIHPTQKPVALYKWLLTNYAKQGDKILDTHGGSGSIAIACHDLKFDLDICELDSDYFQAMQKRFNNHIAQLTIF